MRCQNSIALFLLLLSLPLAAQPVAINGPRQAISLSDAVQMALEHNLEIRIERHNPEIVRLTLDGSYGVYDPLFNASGGHRFDRQEGGRIDAEGRPVIESTETRQEFINSGLTGVLPTGLDYQLSLRLNHTETSRATGTTENWSGNVGAVTLNQPLLKDFWIDQPRMTIKVNKANLKISKYGLLFTIMDVVRRVEESYYELIYSRTNVAVQEAALKLAEQLVAENRKKVEVGVLAPLDEKQAESQAATSRADVVRAKYDLSVAENGLKSLLTDDFATWAGGSLQPSEELIPVVPTFDVMDSWQKGMTMRPDLAQQRTEVERRQIVLKFNYNQLFPSLDVFGTYGHNGLDLAGYDGVLEDFRDGRNPFYSYGGSFSIPLSNKGPRSRYKQSKVEKQQAIDLLKKKEQDILIEIDNAVQATRNSYERIGATREAAEFARIALEAEQKRLDAGKSTPFIVLQLQRDLTSARSTALRALVDYFRAVSALNFRQGTTLQRYRIEVEVK
jgi:outer membrane protein